MLSFHVLVPGEINVANNVILDKEFSFGTCLWLLLCKNNKAIISFLHVCELIKLPLFPEKGGYEWITRGLTSINRGWIFKNSQSSAHLRLTSTIMTDLPGNYVLYISSVPTTCSWALALQTSRKTENKELLRSPSSTYTHWFLSTSSLLLVLVTALVTK